MKLRILLYVIAIVSLHSNVNVYGKDPIIHLKNNTSESIQIDILQNKKSVLSKLTTIAKKGDFKFDNIDIEKPTTIRLFVCDNKCNVQLPDQIDVTFIENGKPVTGKTLYLKWDGKSVDVQKGNKLGFTTKGYSTKNNVSTLAINTSRTRGKALTTADKKAVLEDLSKGEAELANEKKKLEEQKKKPAIAIAKPIKSNEKSPITIGSQREKPKEVYKTDAEIEADAWAQFPQAATYKKSGNQYMMYLSVFGLKDEGSYAELKQQVRERYTKMRKEWDPYKKGISNNESRIALKVWEILNSGESYLQKKLTEDEEAFNKGHA